MSLFEALRLALRRLSVNKLRTALTALGVIIGVAAVVALLGVGDGARTQLTQGVASLGTNLVSVQAGAATTGGVRGAAGTATTLTTDDATAIGGLPGVSAFAPEVSTNALVVRGQSNTTTTVTGTTAAESQVRGYTLQVGTFMSSLLEYDRKLPVAVLGPTTVTDLGLTPASAVGSSVKINGIPFTVIGVTQPKGGGGINPDDYVLVPLTTAADRLVAGGTLRSVSLSVSDPSVTTFVSAEITALLRQRHGIAGTAQDDFSIVSQDQLLAVADQQASIISNFLIGIAAIALLIGGIGIANTMLVAVRERTREIGTRKAIGARQRDLRLQFLVEAVLVTIGGAIVGAVIGAIATSLVGRAINVSAHASLTGVGIAVAAARRGGHPGRLLAGPAGRPARPGRGPPARMTSSQQGEKRPCPSHP
ncbi:ABC transporter permease [Fodinicola feengrottensis]|uniref:ABC transporter permease n=1 Tax=Fodinicola feengrottensis TaxID=435914 RepID=UPI0013D01E36|nr:ABC transporter permease [Fodinicola feengrottensis]